MRVRVIAAAVAALVVATASAEAQDQGGGAAGGRRGGMVAMMMRAMGPLPPDSMSAIVALDDAQHKRYATLYDNFMQTTQPQRDSMRTIMDRMRSARQAGGDPSANQQYRTTIRGLQTQMRQQRKTFDDAVHALLTSDQQKKFDEWRAARRQQAGRRPPR
jgi:Spy/CpxP family protein refolding chaperone